MSGESDNERDLLRIWEAWGIVPDTVWRPDNLAAHHERALTSAMQVGRNTLGELCKLYLQGFPIDWEGFDQGYERFRVARSDLSFDRTRCWLEPSEIRSFAAGQSQSTSLPLGIEKIVLYTSRFCADAVGIARWGKSTGLCGPVSSSNPTSASTPNGTRSSY
jgi:hypothetical protein